MKSYLAAFLVLLTTAEVWSVPVDRDVKPSFIPNQYIISFSSTVRKLRSAEEDHFKWLQAKLQEYKQKNKDATDYGVLHKYNIASNFKGYAALVPDSIASLISEMPNVAYIEQDTYAHAGTVQPKAPWGLNRVAQRALPLSGQYLYPDLAGEGSYVYVIDTGIDVNHPDFEGRAVWGTSFSKEGNVDGNGHGTHCAGTIASASYGVAKKAKVVAVKVLDNNGSGSYANVIAGINWMAAHATNASLVGKAVASMSLGGGRSQAVNDAVAAAVKAGFPFAVAAGNSNKADACNFSPASEPLAFTVGATDKTDNLARFTNIGRCVDILAPGVDIISTWTRNTTNTISGTSMATPHVAGVMALALAERKFASPDDLYKFLSSNASPNQIKAVPANTVNLLLFNGVDTFPTSQQVVEPAGDFQPVDPEETSIQSGSIVF